MDDQRDDSRIIDLFWQRSEDAIRDTGIGQRYTEQHSAHVCLR